MQITKRLRYSMMIQSWIFIVLFLVLIGMLAAVTRAHHAQFDVTQNGRNSLSAGSIKVLKNIKGEIRITAYASKHDPRLGDIRKLIQEFIASYQRVKPDIQLVFVDPAQEPQRTRDAGIRLNGEMVVEYGKRSEHLSTLNEQSLTNLLMSLAREGGRMIMYLDGHGERKLDGDANFDLGEFGKQLTAKGFEIAPLNLTFAKEVPRNANVLVIAGPRIDLLPAEVDKLKQYIQQGGRLLWLIDPGSLHGLQPIAEQLKLVLTPGVAVDPSSEQLNQSPTISLGASYGEHPITNNFSLITIFPFARQIGVDESKDWHTTNLVEVAPQGWLETGKLEGDISFNSKRDTKGPINVAVTMERAINDRTQRVVVVGTGEFLSNQYLGNGGNQDLGINMLNWLAGDERLITIQPRASHDASLNLGKISAGIISLGSLIVLPIAFFGIGGWIWWKKRKL